MQPISRAYAPCDALLGQVHGSACWARPGRKFDTVHTQFMCCSFLSYSSLGKMYAHVHHAAELPLPS